MAAWLGAGHKVHASATSRKFVRLRASTTIRSWHSGAQGELCCRLPMISGLKALSDKYRSQLYNFGCITREGRIRSRIPLMKSSFCRDWPTGAFAFIDLQRGGATMYNGYRFIDSDAHILEPADMFQKYLEPKFRSQIPVAWADYQGSPLAFGFKLVVPSAQGGEYVMPFGADPLDAAGVARAGGAAFDAGARVTLPGHDEAYTEFARRIFAPEIYAIAMDRTGIDYMVVYPTVGLLSTAAPELAPDTAAANRRAYNNWLHDFCSEAGEGSSAPHSVDLRDAEEAAREARRCVREFGFKAVHINPVPVDTSALRRVLRTTVERAGRARRATSDPYRGRTVADEMLYHYLPGLRTAQMTVAFTIGNMLASTALIIGGVLERHPNLRVVHLESGAGWVPFWLDRLAASVQGGFRGLDIPGLKLHPADYFHRQCYISADPDDPCIKQTIETLGDGNIVTATDFAHPEGRRYASAVKELLELPQVALESKRKIMWDNALKLYPIQPD